MMQQLAVARRFFSDNDWRTIVSRLNARDTHPMVQFIKYGICGVGALVVHQTLLMICSLLFWPAFDSSLPQEIRALHLMYGNCVAVLFSTVFAYLTNVVWVFQRGRHHWGKEIFYFVLVSLFSFTAGLAAGPFLVHRFGINSYVSQALLVIVSVMVNFVCRKFFVFKG